MRVRSLLGATALFAALLPLNGIHGAGAASGVRPTGIFYVKGSPKWHPPAAAAAVSTTGNGISYHNGPVMLTTPQLLTPRLYYIWYGAWSLLNPNAAVLLTYLAQHLGGSPYWNINTGYYQAGPKYVSNALTYGGATTDWYSQGSKFNDTGVQNIVSRAISSGRLPKDPNGIYMVMTSADVQETTGLFSVYCGWHSNFSLGGTDIKFGLIGDPSLQGLYTCVDQYTSPNNNIGGDAMASIVAHESEETVTDPDGNAWYDDNGFENADKCAWTYGTTAKAPNGSMYNVVLGSARFMIQENWVNAGGGYCSMK